MTETDWLDRSTHSNLLIRQARNLATPRKLRLITCGSCRLVWTALPLVVTEAAQATELHADALLSDSDYLAIRESTQAILLQSDIQDLVGSAHMLASCLVHPDVPDGTTRALGWLVEFVSRSAPYGYRLNTSTNLRSRICDVIREVLGNPFRPFQPVASWLGGGFVQPDGRTVRLSDAVRGLAIGIHAEQAYDRLPLLADALEDAGAADPDLLAHCRTGTHHLRGCWALDMVLGKT